MKEIFGNDNEDANYIGCSSGEEYVDNSIVE